MPLQVLGVIVLTGHQERRHLHADARLVHPADRVLDRLKPGLAHAAVKLVAPRPSGPRWPRRATGHRLRASGVMKPLVTKTFLQARLPGQRGRVAGVFEEDRRLGIGVRERRQPLAPAASTISSGASVLARHLAAPPRGHCDDLPVLAEPALKVAPDRRDRVRRRSRQKMVQRLLLDRVVPLCRRLFPRCSSCESR